MEAVNGFLEDKSKGLHNGNILPSISVGKADNTKEIYDNMKQLLRRINSDQNNFLLELQSGYNKYCCVFFVNGAAQTEVLITSR